MLKRAVPVVLIIGVLIAVTSCGDGGPSASAAQGKTGSGGIELVYRGQPTGETESVSGKEIKDAIAIIRKRARSLGLRGASVSRLDGAEIKVNLPHATHTTRAIEALGSAGQLHLFDWEPNLLGLEQPIGGHPGQRPPAAALKDLEAEWTEAGRNPKSFENAGLIASGAFPNAYTAALLASEQAPSENCGKCSAAKPRYYLFEKEAPHKLLAGPEPTMEDLYENPTGETLPKDGLVVEIPVGTVLVSELPTEPNGKVDETAQPGWFALKDDPALSGSEITEPKQEYAQSNGEPTVTFGFTPEGRRAFHDVTRAIAERGQAEAIGPVSREEAAALSGHLAVIFDNEVESRPIINFAENPGGIDGRVGAQISGGFSGDRGVERAQELATLLQIGELPIALQLIRER
jgi:preprotein translocase subunit SecD